MDRLIRGVLAVASILCSACGEEVVAPGDVRARLAEEGPPHLVLCLVDTLRPDALTPYAPEAQDPPTTPELAAWARRGVVFEEVRAQSSWTKISMVSLFTSLWPRSHGVREARDGLDESALTLAEVLRDAGYRTHAVQTNGWLHPSFGVQQGFEHYRFPQGGGARIRDPAVWAHADRVYEEARRIVLAHDPREPLFLYLHFMDVHQYAAPPEFQRYGSDARGAYLAATHWVDDTLARVRRLLDHRGMLTRSVLVLASDHGESFGENGVQGHARNVLSAQVRVPLLLRLPFPLAAPLRVSAPVRNLDLAPTLLELAGVEPPESFEGRSLLGLALGEEEDAQARISFAALGQPLFPDARVQQAVADARWTFARNLDGAAPGELLFDRSVDPQENVDLMQLQPEAAAPLRARLEAHEAKASEALRRRNVRIDPGIAERLRALGYLGAGQPLE